jgi:Planctomycete cytochrome C
MKIKTAFILLIGLIGCTYFTVSCKHEIPFDPGSGIPTITPTCSIDTVYFVNTVQPLLNSSCAFAGCHDAVTKKEGVELTSYAKIMTTGGVSPGNPTNSKLFKVLNKTGSDRMPPPPYAGFTQAQKDIVYKWILQGAKNNSCNGCDTTVFTFSGAVSPLMNTYCKGCHNPASLGGGIDLSTYATVKVQALNGKLMGSITHASGFSAMPKGGNKWSDCQIKQVQKWITSGTPNN